MTMKRFFEILRIGAAVALLALAVIFAGSRLMKIQVVDGAMYLEMSKSSKTAVQSVSAARGQIVDISGRPLVENRVAYNIIINESFFPDDRAAQNEVILRLTKLLEADGLMWIDELPITREQPYEYTLATDSRAVKTVFEKLRLASYATAENCVDALTDMYDIPEEWSEAEKRAVAGVRYQMILLEKRLRLYKRRSDRDRRQDKRAHLSALWRGRGRGRRKGI